MINFFNNSEESSESLSITETGGLDFNGPDLRLPTAFPN